MAHPTRGPKHERTPEEPIKTINPLIWIALILALLAICWFTYEHMRDGAPASGPDHQSQAAAASVSGKGDRHPFQANAHAEGSTSDNSNPMRRACARNPGNDVATLATSTISTGAWAHWPATANAIAMR